MLPQSEPSALLKRAGGAPSSLAGVLYLIANVTYWMCAGAYTPFLSSYFSSIGLSATETGILLTVSPIAIILIQPFWARLSDKTGKRKGVLALLCGLSAVSAFLYYLGTDFATVLLATCAFMLFFSALLPLCDALVIDGCARDGVEFARVRMGGTCGYAFVVFVVGTYLDQNPEAQFVLVSALLIVFLISVLLIPTTKSVDGSGGHAESDTCERRAPIDDDAAFGVFRSREIIFILAFVFVSQMGLGFMGSFLGRHIIELGYGQGLVGTLSAVSALSELPILLFADAIVNKFGEIKLLVASCFLMVVRLCLLGSGFIPAMFLGQLMQSVTYMTVYYSCTRYVAQNVLPGHQSQGQSILVMVQSGIAMLVANLSGGFIGDALGMKLSFYASAAFVLLGTTAVLIVYRKYKSRFA